LCNCVKLKAKIDNFQLNKNLLPPIYLLSHATETYWKITNFRNTTNFFGNKILLLSLFQWWTCIEIKFICISFSLWRFPCEVIRFIERQCGVWGIRGLRREGGLLFVWKKSVFKKISVCIFSSRLWAAEKLTGHGGNKQNGNSGGRISRHESRCSHSIAADDDVHGDVVSFISNSARTHHYFLGLPILVKFLKTNNSKWTCTKTLKIDQLELSN